MQRFPQGLFKPGDLPLAGLKLACLEVRNEEELAAALADGWFEDPTEADAARPPEPAAETVEANAGEQSNKPPTRAELEQKATELGIPFKPQTSDKKLAEAIAAKLAE